jgi:hypothetical protein
LAPAGLSGGAFFVWRKAKAGSQLFNNHPVKATNEPVQISSEKLTYQVRVLYCRHPGNLFGEVCMLYCKGGNEGKNKNASN